ncbi:anthranilate synthase component II [Nostoc sp.]|uniref:anthranilate synthase component II n=1 Tax=Nostoc sp. TaxID=1180 RepID=UPI002FFA1057
MQTLIIDNYDSYTFNLYQMIAEVNGELPLVIYNDRLNWDELKEIAFDNIVISPGPGRPERSEDFGVCRQIIENVDVPLLGVCLGHQGLGYLYGGRVIHAPEVRHGRLSKIYHNNSELFQGIPNQFSVVRYHSLLVADELPECLEKIAWTEEGLVMGLRHLHLPFWGVQFHPESICTEYGQRLLENFRGAPKIRTMQIIDRLEQEARGVYSGAIGFLGLNDSADLNIVIRTAVLTPNQTSIGIGGGIIALSEPEMEFQETLLKAKALIDALLLTIHGTSEPDVYPILGLEAITADSYEKLSA